MTSAKKRKSSGATRRKKRFPIGLWIKKSGLVLSFAIGIFIAFMGIQELAQIHWRPLPVKEVTLDQAMVYQAQSEYETRITKYLGKSLLLVDLNKMRQDLESLPWIQKVSLRKRWPGTVQLNVTEYEPVANWNTGEVLNAEGYALQKPAADLKLADLKGPDNRSKMVMDHYLLFTEIFASQGHAVKGVTMQPRGSWSLELDNRLQIYLGEQDVLERTRRVVRFLGSSHVQADGIEYIDARYQNGVAIKMKQNLSSEVEHGVAA